MPTNKANHSYHVGVFAAAQNGYLDVFHSESAETGRIIAQLGCSIVYGGGNSGLMRATVDAALQRGVKVIGVVPECYSAPELLHPGLTKVKIVSTLNKRKAMMQRLSDAVVVLPGGLGTLDELVDLLNANRFGERAKPCALLNIHQYYNDLVRFLDNGVKNGLISTTERSLFVTCESTEELKNWLTVCLNSGKRNSGQV